MIGLVSRNVLRFIFLVLLQVFVLNNIMFSGYINPYAYILFILLLPVETPGWLTMLLAFAIGIAIDVFSRTPGLHASASVFIGFIRSRVLKLLAPRDGYEFGRLPSLADMGFTWFVTYAAIMTLLHHTWLFFAETAHFYNPGFVLLKALMSAIFTLVIILVMQLLAYKPSESS